MQEAGISKAAAMGAWQAEPEDPLGIARTEEIARDVPGLYSIGIADPTRDDADHLARAEQQIRRGKVVALKAYLGYVHHFASDPGYRPYYALAERFKLPVFFHTGDTYSPFAKLKFAHPLTLDEVAVDFPKVNFVLCHVGNPWMVDAAEVVYKNMNVWTDLSGLLVGPEEDFTDDASVDSRRDVIDRIRLAFRYAERPNRFVYGSDSPLAPMPAYVEFYLAGGDSADFTRWCSSITPGTCSAAIESVTSPSVSGGAEACGPKRPFLTPSFNPPRSGRGLAKWNALDVLNSQSQPGLRSTSSFLEAKSHSTWKATKADAGTAAHAARSVGFSGLTIGRGYDMKFRAVNSSSKQMTDAESRRSSAESPCRRAKLRRCGTRLREKDQAAGDTPAQQRPLFHHLYAEIEECPQPAPAPDREQIWSSRSGRTHPTIRDLQIDLRYRGDYTAKTRDGSAACCEERFKKLAQFLADREQWAQCARRPIQASGLRKEGIDGGSEASSRSGV